MSSTIEYDYKIDGTVNRLQSVLGHGGGLTDVDTGETTLTVDFAELPETWDPRTIVMMCCLRSLAMSSRELDGGVGLFRASGGFLTMGHHNPTRREFQLINETGGILVKGAASSITDFRGAKAVDSSTTECFSTLRPGVNGVKKLHPFDGLMQQCGPNLIMVTTTFTAEMEDGTVAYGTTNYPHWLPEPQATLAGPQILRCTEVDQTLVNGRLELRTVTEVTPLVPARQLARA